MKPCRDKRKLIAWLAADALDAGQAKKIRAHVEDCEGCRQYLQEVSCASRKLAAVEVRSDIQGTEAFHRRVLGALNEQEMGSGWQAVVAQLWAALMNWRIALPVIGATVAVIAAFSLNVRPPAPTPVSPVIGSISTVPNVTRDLDPTVSNYQIIANRSLEKLDDLLTRQANRNTSPTPIYTASTLARGDSLD